MLINSVLLLVLGTLVAFATHYANRKPEWLMRIPVTVHPYIGFIIAEIVSMAAALVIPGDVGSIAVFLNGIVLWLVAVGGAVVREGFIARNNI